MKLTSINSNSLGEKLTLTVPFDTYFVKSVKFICKDVIRIDYNLSFATPPVAGCEEDCMMLFAADNEGVFTKATLFTQTENSAECAEYIDEFGSIDCAVDLNEKEWKCFLPFVLSAAFDKNNMLIS